MTGPGLGRAIENADTWPMSGAQAAIRVLAASGQVFESFDLTERFGIELAGQQYGAAFATAAKAGVIEHAGFAVSRRPTRSGGITRLWRGTEQARGRSAA